MDTWNGKLPNYMSSALMEIEMFGKYSVHLKPPYFEGWHYQYLTYLYSISHLVLQSVENIEHIFRALLEYVKYNFWWLQ